MTPALAAPVLAAALLATSIMPGWLFVRRLRWNPLEKLCITIATSLFCVYLFALWAYLLRWPLWVHSAYTIASAVIALVYSREFARLVMSRRNLRALSAFALLLAWTILLLALTRHYAGALFSEDWLQYYHKTLAMLQRTPLRQTGALLLDRPPAMSFIWSHYLAITGRGFESFQLAGLFLNALVFLPCCLIAPALIRRGGRFPLLIAALFMLNPLFVENATYTWTKLFAGFYVICGLAIYLAGLRKHDSARVIWAFALLAFGCLIHFSAVPYAIVMGAHYIIGALLGDPARKWRLLPIIIGCSLAILATWYAWTLGTFGGGASAAANPTLRFLGRHDIWANVLRTARNAVNTIVPVQLRMSTTWFPQPSAWGHVRDLAFTAYESNLFAVMGCVGSTLVLWLTFRALRHARPAKIRIAPVLVASIIMLALLYFGPVRNMVFIALPNMPLAVAGALLAAMVLAWIYSNYRAQVPPLRAQQRFWWGLLIIVPLISFAAQDAYAELGVFNICLQPLALIGLTLLGSALPGLGWPLRILLAVGCAIDFVLGILLQFHLQSLTFENGQTHGLLAQPIINWNEKRALGLSYIGDHFAGLRLAIEIALILGAALLIALLLLAHPRSKAWMVDRG
jgi:hypothetical protein